jgi:hypothetical protein
MNNLGIYTSKIIIFLAMIVGCVLSVYAGIRISESTKSDVVVVIPIFCGFIYLLFFTRFTVFFALFFALIDLKMRPFGFEINAAEQVILVFGFCIAALWWRRFDYVKTNFNSSLFFRIFLCLTGALLIYGGLHFIYNAIHPESPNDYALSNAAKTYLYSLAPFFCLAYFSVNPSGLTTGIKPSQLAAQFFLVCLLFNLAVAIYRVKYFGIGDDFSYAGGVLKVPFFNATENVYVLRTLGPFAALLGAVFLTSRAEKVSKFLAISLMFVGVTSTLWSGGRASLLFALGFALAVCIYRRKFIWVFTSCVYLVVCMLIVNALDSSTLQNMPFFMQRSLSYFILKEETEATRQIAGSSSERKRWFELGIKEWKSSPRIFWFGRSSYSFRESDIIGLLRKDQDSFDDAAVRRVATHNLISDVLIMYGLVGAILYYATCLSLAAFLFMMHRKAPPEREEHDWALISMTMVLFYTLYASVGGGWFWILICVVIIYTSLISRKEAKEDLVRRGEAQLNWQNHEVVGRGLVGGQKVSG